MCALLLYGPGVDGKGVRTHRHIPGFFKIPTGGLGLFCQAITGGCGLHGTDMGWDGVGGWGVGAFLSRRGGGGEGF